MSVATATRIREGILEPAMDARAINLEEAGVLARLDTPEADSVIEDLAGMRARPAAHEGWFLVHEQQIASAENGVWKATELNGREGQLERAVAGNAEIAAAELYSVAGRRSYSYKVIAAELKDALDVLVELRDAHRPNPSAREIDLANRLVRAAVRDLPADTLRGEQLHRQLGRAKTAVLLDYLAAKEASS